MYIVGFNGPPQCGKDTLATLLADHMDKQGVRLPVRTVHLSAPLRRIAYAMIGQVYGAADAVDYGEFKKTSFDVFGWKTGRELMIDVSESFLKPKYGPDIMAELWIEYISGFHGVVLVPDCGFQAEIDLLARIYGFRKMYIATAGREGCSFDNDSRSYVTHQFSHHYDNNRDLAHWATEAGRIYGRLVNNLGWQI